MITGTLDIKKVEKVAFILKAIGNPLRIGIIDVLRLNDELSVTEISRQLEAEQSLVSHNLLNMKLKGILDSRRAGKNIYYRLKLREVLKVIECMENCDMDNI
jgi:DNA-binding transcriptional ArsR family regulator